MNLLLFIFVLSLSVSISLNESSDNQISNTDDESNDKPLIMRSVDENPQLPKETQMAQCTVQSGDIKASAQATFSKKLEGFCSTEDMKMLKESLLNMESRLYRDIYNLQLLIQNVLPQHLQQRFQNYPAREIPSNPYQRENYYQNPSASKKYDDRSTVNNYITTTLPTTTTTTTTPSSTTFKTPQVKSSKMPEVINSSKLKSLDTNHHKSNVIKKQQEKTTTVKPSKNSNQYIYYWKVDHFPTAFKNAKKNEVFSHVFNVKGIFLRIRAALHFSENENFLLDIEHLANIDNTEKMEIEISDGVIFKEIAEEKLFQYSFAILNQVNPNHDLISPAFWNTENDNFIIPNSIHLLPNYLKDNSLLIKLIISF